MNGPRALLVASACGLTLAAAGCGSSAHRATSSPAIPRRPANHYASHTTQSGRSIGPGTIVLRRLGTIHFGCAGTSGMTAVLDPRGVLATETAYVEDGGHRHLRQGTIQPGTTFTATNSASRSEVWHVIQETEPETLDARITITVEQDCTGQWRAQVGVISHTGSWTPPRPWL